MHVSLSTSQVYWPCREGDHVLACNSAVAAGLTLASFSVAGMATFLSAYSGGFALEAILYFERSRSVVPYCRSISTPGPADGRRCDPMGGCK